MVSGNKSIGSSAVSTFLLLMLGLLIISAQHSPAATTLNSSPAAPEGAYYGFESNMIVFKPFGCELLQHSQNTSILVCRDMNRVVASPEIVRLKAIETMKELNDVDFPDSIAKDTGKKIYLKFVDGTLMYRIPFSVTGKLYGIIPWVVYYGVVCPAEDTDAHCTVEIPRLATKMEDKAVAGKAARSDRTCPPDRSIEGTAGLAAQVAVRR